MSSKVGGAKKESNKLLLAFNISHVHPKINKIKDHTSFKFINFIL